MSITKGTFVHQTQTHLLFWKTHAGDVRSLILITPETQKPLLVVGAKMQFDLSRIHVSDIPVALVR